MKFKAVTENGTVYEGGDGGRIRITDEYGPYTFMPLTMKAVFHEDIPDGLTYNQMFDHIRTLPEVEVPLVGASLYVAGFNEWRLSTAIETVEVYKDKD